jgi:CRP/FNR family transcriptional regulator
MYVDGRHHCSMSAVTDVGACFVEISAFKKIIGQNPKFAEEFIKFLSVRTIHTFNRFLNTTQKNMEGRIAEALLYFSTKVFTDGKILNVTKQDFADFTSMTRESAIRVLKEFKDEGVIDEHDRSIEILDEKALTKYAELG